MNSLSQQLVVLALVGVTSVAGWTSSPTGHAQESVLEDFVGTYRFSGGRRERQALANEIDRVADQLGFLIRGIARGQMHDRIRPHEEVRFDTTEDNTVRVFLGDRPALPCDGSPHAVRSDRDDPGTSVCSYANGRVTVRSAYDGTTNVMRFWRGGEGRLLRMSVTLRSEQLPDVIRYRLTYRIR
ncbi:MAG: hypothetical protein AAGF12_36885 [Myxococcota bacterium]